MTDLTPYILVALAFVCVINSYRIMQLQNDVTKLNRRKFNERS